MQVQKNLSTALVKANARYEKVRGESGSLEAQISGMRFAKEVTASQRQLT
jgi:hypothetical protein